MTGVSIVMPCWNRAQFLPRTIDSILRQSYPGELEFVIVETGNDGTQAVAERYGCRYLNFPRDEHPLYQHLCAMWNIGIREAKNEIVILQNAEIVHESGGVVSDLVALVESGPKVHAMPLVKDAEADGTFRDWCNHPTEGCRPRWRFGGGPMAFLRADLLWVGGWEELFYGYGHEDDFFFYLLNRHGFKLEYAMNAVCTHWDHERVPYDPTTGYANRALIRLLTFQIEHGLREPFANRQPLAVKLGPTDDDLSDEIMRLWRLDSSKVFKQWAERWISGDRTPDDNFTISNYCLNEGRGMISGATYHTTEAAYSFLRAKRDKEISEDAWAKGMDKWSARASFCAVIHETWAATALAQSREINP